MSGSLEDVVGRRYGPVTSAASRGAVAGFVDATGDDPARWVASVPPTYASAALFQVAPLFLADPEVAPFTRSLIHSEQRFAWHASVPHGAELSVVGEVAAVRSRGALNLVTFELAVDAGGERWLDGTAVFLMSDEAASSAEDDPEPPHDARAENDRPAAIALPDPGTAMPSMRRSASRADLVRYAGASGDWNPIHWDHEAARAAGLSGVVVHGLLMASWIAQSAVRVAAGEPPLQSLRLRFRRPLRPAVGAEVTGSVTSTDAEGADLALTVVAEGDTLVSASARVTP
ncbi:MAG TPA: MaoC/PaaZ C-terminal domain-containing protein [Acidimicrobiia bacterium]|nr:MaoC/PaaZ C-terminal domain-containing protein [Acidimicrobiia bacterium]